MKSPKKLPQKRTSSCDQEEARGCTGETERHQTMISNLEAALRHRQAILDGMKVLVVATDNLGVISFVNLIAQKQLGFSACELVGKETPLLFQPSNIVSIPQNRPIQKFTKLDSSNQKLIVKSIKRFPANIFCTLFRRDKSNFSAKISISPLKSDCGNITGYLAR